ncbi:hypothetical protein M422DRAFT_264237, partial [Sphaerobolus stellatus SS14]
VPVSITSSRGLVPTIPLSVPVSTTSSRRVATTSSSISKTTQPIETSIPFPSVLSSPTTEHSTSATEVPTVRRVTSETSSDIGNAMSSMHLQSLTSVDNEGSTRTTSLTGMKGETAGTTMHQPISTGPSSSMRSAVAGYLLLYGKRRKSAFSVVEAWTTGKEETGRSEDPTASPGVHHDEGGRENGSILAVQSNPPPVFNSSVALRTLSIITAPPYIENTASGLDDSMPQIEGPPPRLLDTTDTDFIVSRFVEIAGGQQGNNVGNE